MWGSLLLLPVLSVSAIFLLFRLDNATLRRSLQFAIILSLALHLFVLVFASVVNIFQNPFQPKERQVAQQREVRTIEVADRRAAFVWEETNSRETPETKVKPERQEQPTTKTKPQPIPVPETKPEINPQLTKREKTAESVPRQNRQLSQLRRQTRDLQPRSSQQNTGSKSSTQKTASSTTKPQESLSSSREADSVARQSAPAAQTQPEPTRQSAAAPSNQKQEVARTSSSPRRSDPQKPPTESPPRASASTARVRRSTPNIPVASSKSPALEKVAKATTKTPSESQPSKAASQTTRRPERSQTTSPALANRPRTELSPRPQVARSAQRRSTNRIQPSISSNTSISQTPRRSTREAQVVSSPVPVERPSRSPQSNSASRELNSKSLSVTRSTEGVAGIGRSKNLDRFAGGMTSPASRSSDSARRERTQSKPNEARMLSSSQRSETRRAVGANRQPTSTFKAETSSPARIAGASNPGERTLESSAAAIDSASTAHRDSVSAERGESSVDLGPTKVVMDRQTPRRSGGGQPEVAQLNPESTRSSKERSQLQPSLSAAPGLDVASPSNPSSAMAANEAIEASEESALAARMGGDSPITAERRAAEISGESSDQGPSDLAQALADSRARADRFQDESGWQPEDEDDDGDNPGGTKRTRVAQAPVVRMDPGTGIARSDGRARRETDEQGDSPSESLATRVSRQANAAIPGTGITRSATNALLQAATSLPIIDSSSSRRKGSASSDSPNSDLKSGMANRRSDRARTPSPSPSPSFSGTANAKTTERSRGKSSSGQTEIDASDVTVGKTDIAAKEQIQGAKLDVLAEEGPAGLGVRPDELIGVMTRPAARDSEQLQPNLNSRFRNPRFGGTPAVNPDAVIAREAFSNRNPAKMSSVAEPTTEAAIHLGLEFLARHQQPDGSWSLTGFDRDSPQYKAQLDSDSAATGLALLAFQGAGYNHREFKYARQIDRALQWLIENQAEDGGLYVASDSRSNGACRLYSHGIAALALTEAYGMTQDVRLKEPAQKALNYIARSQHPRKGGWRYFVERGRQSTDTSVSGWMMMALQSGRLAGLEVDPETFDGIEDWLDVAADPENASVYRYNPYAENSKGVSRERQGRTPTASMTSVGLLMRIYSGWDRDDPRLLAGADYLLATQLPADSSPILRDTYYWYYATQVLKHVDGDRWKRWNDRLRPLLTRSQEKNGDMAGSWHPYRPVPDRWGQFGGRIYVTTMNLLSLEVRHRMLPLYKQGDDKPPKSSSLDQSKSNGMSSQVSTKSSANRRNARTVRKPAIDRELARSANNRPVSKEPVVHPVDKRTNTSWPVINSAIPPGDIRPAILRGQLVKPVGEYEPAPSKPTQRTVSMRMNQVSRSDVGTRGQVADSPRPDLALMAQKTTSRGDDAQSVITNVRPNLANRKLRELPRIASLPTPMQTGPNLRIRWPSNPESSADLDLADLEAGLSDAGWSRTQNRSSSGDRIELASAPRLLPANLKDLETPIPPITLRSDQGPQARLFMLESAGMTKATKRPRMSRVPIASQFASVMGQTPSKMPMSLAAPVLPDAAPDRPLLAVALNTPQPMQRNEFEASEQVSRHEEVTRPKSLEHPLGDPVVQRDAILRNDLIQQNRPANHLSDEDIEFEVVSAVIPRPMDLARPTYEPLNSIPLSTRAIALAQSNPNRQQLNPNFGQSMSRQRDSEFIAPSRRLTLANDTMRDRTTVILNLKKRVRMARQNLTQRTIARIRVKRDASKLPTPVPSTKVPLTAEIAQNSNSIPVMSQASSRVTAAGQITLDGEILKDAKIELVPIDIKGGERITMRTNDDGKFKFESDGTVNLPAIKVGKYQVCVTTFVESPDENVIDYLEIVPPRYNSQTELVISVSEQGPNVFDLELESE